MENFAKIEWVGVIVILALAVILIPALITHKVLSEANYQAPPEPSFPQLAQKHPNSTSLSADNVNYV
jgi:cell division septation protein DedD